MTGSLGALETAFWGVLTFSILVVLHEMGHFLAARAFGVKVHEFMVGLPGPALRLHAKDMDWGVTAIPLGGYVRIAGMEPGPEDELLGAALVAIRDHGPYAAVGLSRELGITEERAESVIASLLEWKAIRPDGDGRYLLAGDGDVRAETADSLLGRARSVTYRGQSTLRRVVILGMGVATNLLVAVLTFTIVLSIWGYYEASTTLAVVEDGSPAAAAGLAPGDVLVSLNGTGVTHWDEFQMRMATTDPGATVSVGVRRGPSEFTVDVELAERDGHGYLGVGPKTIAVRPSVLESIRESFRYVGLVFKSIASLFNPATFGGTVRTLAGPVGVSVLAEEAAKAGPLSYAGLIAMLSLSLGAMNLLPLPPLDGGKIVLEVIEGLRGRPLSRNLTLGLSAAGAILLFALIGYVMYLDIVRYAV